MGNAVTEAEVKADPEPNELNAKRTLALHERAEEQARGDAEGVVTAQREARAQYMMRCAAAG